MSRRWQRGWMKEGGNVNDSLTTRFICKIRVCSRIRRMNRIFWKFVDQKLEEIKGNGSFNAGLGATVGQ
ncbi:Zinc finger protein GIS2 [Fusarium oxysporum f. sp. albedinis]|nr:Zinc finger protein GIS2 [Fusarium oxysporum f. sp. albedinis]